MRFRKNFLRILIIILLIILSTYISKYISSDIFNYNFLSNISNLYACLIIAFISGMQWQRIIINKQKNLLFIPLLPLLLALSYENNFFIYYSSFILVFSMFLSLFIDIKIHKKINESWFKKLRIKATILASISFLI